MLICIHDFQGYTDNSVFSFLSTKLEKYINFHRDKPVEAYQAQSPLFCAWDLYRILRYADYGKISFEKSDFIQYLHKAQKVVIFDMFMSPEYSEQMVFEKAAEFMQDNKTFYHYKIELVHRLSKTDYKTALRRFLNG